jgi:hypothetical protein
MIVKELGLFCKLEYPGLDFFSSFFVTGLNAKAAIFKG